MSKFARALLALSCLLPWLATGPVVAQEQIALWQEPMISVVWPHDGNGNPTSVSESRMVNVSIWPSNQVPCCDEPPIALVIAKDNEPTEWLGYDWDREVMERTIDGITFPSLEYNNIPADLIAEPTASYRFFASSGDYSNVWVHAADARTIFPEPVVPTGYIDSEDKDFDVRIQIVWPHDEQGQFASADQATRVNIAIDLFAHGTLNSVPLDYEPKDLSLMVAQGNGRFRVQSDLVPEKITYTVDDQTYPRWVFNDVPVEPGQQYNFAPSLYAWYYSKLPSMHFTIWTHAADARTLLPDPEPPQNP